jgi:hypothetical protein
MTDKHFVARAVLKSSDDGHFELQSTNSTASARPSAGEGTLYQRLQENEAQKQAEWEESRRFS